MLAEFLCPLILKEKRKVTVVRAAVTLRKECSRAPSPVHSRAATSGKYFSTAAPSATSCSRAQPSRTLFETRWKGKTIGTAPTGAVGAARLRPTDSNKTRLAFGPRTATKQTMKQFIRNKPRVKEECNQDRHQTQQKGPRPRSNCRRPRRSDETFAEQPRRRLIQVHKEEEGFSSSQQL